jgi:hypothetical protein
MDYVEVLAQADEVLKILERAGPFSTVKVHGVRRTADWQKLCVPRSDLHGAAGTGQGEFFGGACNCALYETSIEPDLQIIDLGSGLVKKLSCTIVHDPDAQLLQHSERRVVDAGNLIIRIPGRNRQWAG